MRVLLKKISLYIRTNKLPLILFGFFLLSHLTHLTLLPMWNDEAIYLDWGWRETHVPGYLYYSLVDAKQPLEFWLFGVAESIFSDPLFAGRFISVLFSCATWSGLYVFTKQVINRKTALLTVTIYGITPLFFFFDRQALVESAITAVGVWSLYFLYNTILHKSKKYATALGITLGVGFFIKSTTLLFILPSLLLIILQNKKRMKLAMTLLFRVLIAIVTIDLLLLINPEFWQTITSNSRYVLTFSELIKFPYTIWITSLFKTLQVLLISMPLFFSLLAILGGFIVWRKKSIHRKIVVAWFLVPLALELLLIRGQSDRYLASFLSLVPFFASIGIMRIFDMKKFIATSVVCISLALSFLIICIECFSPIQYLLFFSKIPLSDASIYLTNYTSGIGISEIIAFAKQKATHQDIYLGYAENTGNPESAVLVYFQNNSHITPSYLTVPKDALNKYDCLQSQRPFYFITRGEYLANLNKFLTEEKRIYNPYDSHGFIGIYSLKTNCPKSKTGIITPEIKNL